MDVLNLKSGALAFAPACEQLLIQALFCQRYSGYGYRVTAGFYVWFMLSLGLGLGMVFASGLKLRHR